MDSLDPRGRALAGAARADPPPPSQAERPAWLRVLARACRDLSTRITISVAAGALVVMALAHFMHVRLLHDEMQPEIGKQLYATVARAADDVDGRIERRTRALEAAATEIELRHLDADAAQVLLERQGALLSMFDHLMVVGADGRVLADRPRGGGARHRPGRARLLPPGARYQPARDQRAAAQPDR